MTERVWLSEEEFEKQRAERREEERVRLFYKVNESPLPDGMKAIIEKEKALAQSAPETPTKPISPEKQVVTRYWWNEHQNKTIEDLGNWYD